MHLLSNYARKNNKFFIFALSLAYKDEHKGVKKEVKKVGLQQSK